MAKLKTKVLKYLQDADVFGQPIQLFFNGDSSRKTSFGGMLTLIIVFFVFSLLVVLSIGLYSRNNYTTSTEHNYNINPPPIDLFDGFMFSLGVQDSNITFANSIFSYTATHSTYAILNGVSTLINKTMIPLSPCSQNDFHNMSQEYNQYLLNSTLCPNLQNISIAGKFSSPIFSYVKLNISRCINETNNGVTCASNEFIDEYYSKNPKIRIVLYFLNSLITLDNYENPVSHKFIDDLYWIISPKSNITVSTDIYLQVDKVNSLDNIFGVGSGWNASAIAYHRDRSDNIFVPNSVQFNEFLEIFLRADNYEVIAIRKYQTLPDILSILGGIWNILYLVLGYFASQYSKELFTIDLANAIYDFDINESEMNQYKNNKKNNYVNEKIEVEEEYEYYETHPNNIKYTKNNDKQVESKQKHDLIIGFSNNNITNNSKYLIEEYNAEILTDPDFLKKFSTFHHKKRSLQYNANDLFKSIFPCFCFQKRNIKRDLLLHKANTKIARDIDIRIVLKKLKEIENIKNVIFDQDQLDIFNFAHHELIGLEHEGSEKKIKKAHLQDQIMFLKNQLEDLCHKKKEFLYRQKAYNSLKNRNDIISLNLLQKLDQDIKEIFNILDEKINLQIPKNLANIISDDNITPKANEIKNANLNENFTNNKFPENTTHVQDKILNHNIKSGQRNCFRQEENLHYSKRKAESINRVNSDDILLTDDKNELKDANKHDNLRENKFDIGAVATTTAMPFDQQNLLNVKLKSTFGLKLLNDAQDNLKNSPSKRKKAKTDPLQKDLSAAKPLKKNFQRNSSHEKQEKIKQINDKKAQNPKNEDANHNQIGKEINQFRTKSIQMILNQKNENFS